MPRFILKTAPQVDLYVEWSTIVDDATWVGTRAEALRQFDRPRIDRADQTGTSELQGRLGAWDDEALIVQQRGLLDRDKLSEYASVLLANVDPDGTEEAHKLLRPFDDD